jgi:hypothetical protein
MAKYQPLICLDLMWETPPQNEKKPWAHKRIFASKTNVRVYSPEATQKFIPETIYTEPSPHV